MAAVAAVAANAVQLPSGSHRSRLHLPGYCQVWKLQVQVQHRVGVEGPHVDRPRNQAQHKKEQERALCDRASAARTPLAAAAQFGQGLRRFF